MKPDSTQAMQSLIDLIRRTFPFERPEAQFCRGPCQGCSMKLLAYLESELDDWEQRLTAGEKAGLAELSQMLRTSRRIERVLVRAGLMEPLENAPDINT